MSEQGDLPPAAQPPQANGGNHGENYGIGQFLNMPPSWSPSCGLKWVDWDRKVEIWEDLTSLPVAKRGLALTLVLGGEARRIADKVPLPILKREGSPDAPEAANVEDAALAATNLLPMKRRQSGINYLRLIIENRFGIEEQDKAIQALMRFFGTRRKRGEDMMTWLSRFDICLAEAGSHGLTMSILATNFLTMFWGGMSMQDIVNALAPVRGKIPDTEATTTELRSHLRRQETLLHRSHRHTDQYYDHGRSRSNSRSSRSTSRSRSSSRHSRSSRSSRRSGSFSSRSSRSSAFARRA